MSQVINESPPTAVSEAGGKDQQASESNKKKKTPAARVASAVSVVSGYRYFARAITRTGRDLKMPILREGISDVKKKADAYRSGVEIAAAETLDLQAIRRSLLGHILILVVVIPAGIVASLIAANGLGLLLRHGIWIPQGHYGAVTGPLFMIFAIARSYISLKSAAFFWQLWKHHTQESAANDSYN